MKLRMPMRNGPVAAAGAAFAAIVCFAMPPGAYASHLETYRLKLAFLYNNGVPPSGSEWIDACYNAHHVTCSKTGGWSADTPNYPGSSNGPRAQQVSPPQNPVPFKDAVCADGQAPIVGVSVSYTERTVGGNGTGHIAPSFNSTSNKCVFECIASIKCRD